MIGVCPQFSVLWDSLTVREHLLFYARLKGVPARAEDSHVRHYLREFGLLDSADKLARDLSGGMQRRLAVAIALVGHSEIVFLDEPVSNNQSNICSFAQDNWIGSSKQATTVENNS